MSEACLRYLFLMHWKMSSRPKVQKCKNAKTRKARKTTQRMGFGIKEKSW